MDIEQIYAAAEAESPYLNDHSYIRILVASLRSDKRASTLRDVFQNTIDKNGLHAEIVRTGSFGLYDLEPIVVIESPDSSGVLYHNIIPDDIPFLIDDCLKQHIHKRDKAVCWIGKEKVNGIPHIDEFPLFKLQNRIALRNCGWIDPGDIKHYIMHGHGYTGLSKALHMEQEELLSVLTGSALRGRYGMGSSVSDTWKLCGESKDKDKFLICNAAEADPQAHTTRLLFESDPHSVLEGMLISAYALSASRCFIFIKKNAGFVQRIKEALEQMKAYGLLGDDILDSNFTSEIEIREMPVASTPGYETELFRCIEEKQSLPHVHPVCPIPDELERSPAVITNPEIMSNLSADPVGSGGKSGASGVFTLSGCIAHKYTVEASMETTVRCAVNELGGGASNGKSIKAAKLGGPAGLFIAPDLFDKSLSSVIGEESNPHFCSGSIEVFDSDLSIVDAAKNAMSYIQARSCGRCIFCREGSLQMLTILEDIAENRGKPQDLELLAELGKEMKATCLCAFGRAAPDPVLSSIKHFGSEYAERIRKSS